MFLGHLWNETGPGSSTKSSTRYFFFFLHCFAERERDWLIVCVCVCYFISFVSCFCTQVSFEGISSLSQWILQAKTLSISVVSMLDNPSIHHSCLFFISGSAYFLWQKKILKSWLNLFALLEVLNFCLRRNCVACCCVCYCIFVAVVVVVVVLPKVDQVVVEICLFYWGLYWGFQVLQDLSPLLLV